tara:strand:+ start:444 stop:1325 length:882 start_codon:yes stop_codon:yes gene_type:complete
MNNTTLGALIIGIGLFLLASFYLFSYTMPFGMGGTGMGMNDTEMGEHSDEIATYEISPSSAVKRMQSDQNVVVLDVRTLEEYTEIHLEGSLLLPVQELSQQSLTEIGLGVNMKNKEIILYDRSGSRSKTAYDIMTSLGYRNLKSVAGGMIHWQEDDYPLTETGPYEGPGSDGMSSSEKVIPERGANITLDRTFHDFGEIPQYGGVVNTSFTVTNEGEDTLEIGDITTSCSCTSATVEKSSIEPGESVKLNVVFDPDLHAEPLDVFKRTVFIPTNDPNSPEAEVVIQVDILEGE